MTGLLTEIAAHCADAFERAGFERKFGAVRVSDRPDLADFQCNGALAVAKSRKMNPMEAAEQILAHLDQPALFSVELVKPGFLNFKASDGALAALAEKVAADPRSLAPVTDEPQHILLDYGGPNLAKEMHVGHLRSSIVGHALNTLMRFAGHRTTSDVHLGDWGLQIGQLISQIEDDRPELLAGGGAFDMSDLQVWYPRASARSKEDEAFKERARTATAKLQAGDEDYLALWRRIAEVSSQSLQRDFGRLGVFFDLWYGESRYQPMLGDIVERLRKDGVAEIDDGAVVIRLPDEEKLPPLILRNSNGGYGYGATDMATIYDRVSDDRPDVMLYVVDARQKAHFRQVFGSAKRAGYLDGVAAEHIAFGTVNGTDGKPFKTRAGGVMRMHDLLETMSESALKRLNEAGATSPEKRARIAEEIAIAAIRYGELSHDREKNYVFDMDQFLQFEGATGPYIQYTCVRVRSLMARAAAVGKTPGAISELGGAGRDLALCLDELPTQVERAIKARKPNLIANHAFKLANRTNSFYQANRIIDDSVSGERAASHLGLLDAATRQLALCLDLLGIAIPDEM